MNNQTAHLLISSNQSDQQHLMQLDQLDRAACGDYGLVHLTMGSGEPIRPSTALGYIEAIQRLQAQGVRVVATAAMPLIGSLACVWIAAELRRIASGSYLVLPLPAAALVDREDDGDQRGRTGTVTVQHAVLEAEAVCYRRCLDSIEPHVHLPDVAGQTLFEPQLRELLLVGPLPPEMNPQDSLPAPEDKPRLGERGFSPQP